jgi:hypothetical protein
MVSFDLRALACWNVYSIGALSESINMFFNYQFSFPRRTRTRYTANSIRSSKDAPASSAYLGSTTYTNRRANFRSTESTYLSNIVLFISYTCNLIWVSYWFALEDVRISCSRLRNSYSNLVRVIYLLWFIY